MKLTPECKQLLAEGMPAMIATSGKSGKPNVSPKGSLRVLDDEHLLFVDSNSPRTTANLRENPQVAVICFNAANRKGCRVWGKAEIITSGPFFDQIAKDVATRRGSKTNAVIKVAIEEAVTF